MKKYDILLKAYKNGYAIPQFNIINVEYARYILEECQELKAPVILGVSPKVAKHLGGFNVARKMIDGLIKDLKIKVPVILHLDHAKESILCKQAIEAGFDSVMLDLSSQNFDKNLQEIKKLEKKYKDTIIECEIGSIGKNGNEGIIYASLEEIIKMKKETNIELIAPALGTVHGIYKGEPKINFGLMKKINNKIKTPLVMHGGSGLSKEIFKKSIKNGITKININTELKQAWTKSIREYLTSNKEETDPVYIIESTEKEIKRVVRELIIIFGTKNKA